jgi:hypothetical protein
MQEVERLREYLNIVPLFVIHTGKSLSEALIFASTNPQYVHKLLFLFCFDIQNNFGTQHVLQMLRASEKNLPVLNNNTVHMQLLNFQTYPSP